MRIDFTNAVVEDDGYGVEVNGRSLSVGCLASPVKEKTM